MYEFCIRDERMAEPRPLAGAHLDELHTFSVVARTLSFTRAAERLATDRRAIQDQIDRLEQLLTTKLFARHEAGLELTERGKQLVAALDVFEGFSMITDDEAAVSADTGWELDDEEWVETKRLALEMIQADKLDTPDAHLAYVRDRIRAALARDVV